MNKEYDKTDILYKMENIRSLRDSELQDNGNILDVIFLGTIEIDKEEKEVFVLIEESKDKNGNMVKVERYYTEDGEFIAGDNKQDVHNQIMLSEKYQNQQMIIEKLENFDKEGIESLNEMEQERCEGIAKSLDISNDDIQKLSEIDLEKERKDKKEKSKEEDLSEEEVAKIPTKSEIKIGTKVTDQETIEEMLNVQDKDYRSIAVVYSDKLKEKGNSTKFAFVGVKKDGSVEVIDSLEQKYGSNPTEKAYSIGNDAKIEEDQVSSIYKVKGKKETEFVVDIGPMGTIETTIRRTPKQDKEKAIEIPIENQSIRPIPKQLREFMNEHKNVETKDNIEEIDAHIQAGCEKIEIEDFDDNKYNDTHKHEVEQGSVSNDIDFDRLVDKVFENNEKLREVYNRKDVTEKLQETLKNEKELDEEELDEEELVAVVTLEMEADAEDEHIRGTREMRE